MIIIRNILSYSLGTTFLGQEINIWINDQIQNHRSHFKEALRLHRQYRIGTNYGFISNHQYELVRMAFHTRGPYQLGFLRAHKS